jgi:hypothetical protein
MMPPSKDEDDPPKSEHPVPSPHRQYHHKYRIRQKVICVFFLLLALFVLRQEPAPNAADDGIQEHHDHTQKRWAVWIALRKHPPSLRIFRSLLEWNLILWGTAASLALWYRYIGRDMVAELLFAPATMEGHGDLSDDHNHHTTKHASSREYSYDPMAGSFPENGNAFVDHDVSFSEVDTGCVDDDDDDNSFVRSKKQHQSKREIAISIEAQRQKPARQQEEDGAEEEEEEEDEDEDDISPFDAHIHLPYAPSVQATTSAALDMLLPILIALFLFTFLSTTTTTIAAIHSLKWMAPLVSLLLAIYLTLTQLLRPWKPRKHFFIICWWTMGAPLYPVTFRDGFIGDIMTSSVRPLQDVAFTLCYIVTGLQGYWSAGHEGLFDSLENNPHNLLNDDDNLNSAETMTTAAATTEEAQARHSFPIPLPPLETSWWLHTILLPMCMVSPLWWRFLQNLRQSHDTRKRWPYLGNAFKYLLAAEVAMFGVFDPSKQQTYLWLTWFVIATIYQIWWDVVMDWELLVPTTNNGSTTSWWAFWNKYQFRETRLYPMKMLYTSIVAINFVLRFGWTLSFLPPQYLNQAGILSDTFQHSDWSRILSPAIASAEILRRTLWGWLRLENEAIKVRQQEETGWLHRKQLELQYYRGDNPEQAFEHDHLKLFLESDDHHHHHQQGGGLEPISIMGEEHYSFSHLNTRWAFHQRDGIIPTLWRNFKTMEQSSEIQILAELSVWAAVFTTLGLIAAAHRMTL